MRRLVNLCALLLIAGGMAMNMRAASVLPSFRVVGTHGQAWANIFSSIGIPPSIGEQAEIVVADGNAQADLAALAGGHLLIIEGNGALAQKFGIVPDAQSVLVRRVVDCHAPGMKIIWAEPLSIPLSHVPGDFHVFASEYAKNAPLIAGKRTAHGAVLWLATEPGATGIERYPYILQALTGLGLTMPVRGTTLWSFFDSAYRSRADVDYLAQRWRKAGISELHVAAWHNMEPDFARDEYLKNLILACHRNAIAVYAWLELPHVSEQFWNDHPQWREKTAVGEDAQLDWRKLMNLENPDCKRAVAREVGGLLSRFDWDGVNLAELYFESLEGAANPVRFTPMNDDVRREFERRAGFDPQRLFDANSPHSAARDPAGLRAFLDFRAKLAEQMQADWLSVVEQSRRQKPWLGVVLTHIDDRLEPGMRDALGADTSRLLPVLQARKATVLVEDPATLWNLGAVRYQRLAEKWSPAMADQDKLAVDINVVERYQDVYPTKKQTGTELFQLVHQASASFLHVALYFESSIERQDMGLLPVAAATRVHIEQPLPDEIQIETLAPVRLKWRGPAELDGKPWPLKDENSVLIPRGKHRLSVGIRDPPVTIGEFNGKIGTVAIDGNTVEISYVDSARVLALPSCPVASIDVDGSPYWPPAKGGRSEPIVLPAGEHFVSFHK